MPRSPIRSSEFIALSACTMTLSALGVDIMLPVFSELRKYFGLGHNSPSTADIVTFFFLGQVTQFIFGISSDRFGRLPVLRVGFPLYIIMLFCRRGCLVVIGSGRHHQRAITSSIKSARSFTSHLGRSHTIYPCRPYQSYKRSYTATASLNVWSRSSSMA